ncbi:MAG: hypothetical protein AABX37_05070 [Nanoarchaeota archaeon]
MITYTLFIGILGMLLILIAFILDEFYKRWNQNTVQYNILNIIGSALLVYYALTLRAWPFVVLNIVWFAAAGYKLLQIEQKKK